jgi:hypothetical protein
MSQIIGVPPQADQEGELLNPETESAYGGKRPSRAYYR